MATAAVQREYETIYVLRPDAGREASENIASRVTDVIKTDGMVTQIENWGRRKLAYAVSKYQRGVYVYFKYLGTGEIVGEVERALRLQESVMKFQTVKVSDAPAAPADAAPATFEHIEELEDDDDETYAQSLGLERSAYSARESEDDDSDEGADEKTGGGEAEANAAEASAEKPSVDESDSSEANTEAGGQDE